MEAANLQRKKGWYGNFAIITAILALGHFVGLQYSISFANELDDQATKDPQYAPGWYIKENIPFAAILGLFAIVQFGASLAILIQHRKQGAAKALYYNALLGLLTSFALGVYFSILASEYNTFGRTYPKDDKTFKSFIPFYYCMQIDAVATFLFTVPMFLFTFYYNLEEYLKEQRETSIQVLSDDSQNKQIWLLSLFLVNSFAHIAFIYNVYQFTDIQQPKDYSLQNIADEYTFYIAVEVFVCLAALIAQVHHFRKPFLRKNQLILIATLAAVFQFGSFIIMSVKAVQFYLDFTIIKNDNCYFPDCAQAKTFRWEILSYSIFTLITLIGQVPYFRIISNIVERSQSRDTLLTTEEVEK